MAWLSLLPVQRGSPPVHGMRLRPRGTGQRHKILFKGDSRDTSVFSSRIAGQAEEEERERSSSGASRLSGGEVAASGLSLGDGSVVEL
mmetsp:Transcript_13555/g.28507  ORF Transcript_13555/g.28507 Transcript_13555/m.28507 type:complete len:88 (-) Transcript_13555:216-479(-)